MKKIITIAAVLIIIAGLTIYFIPWGAATSDVKKSKLKTENSTGENGETPTSQDINVLNGTYTASVKKGDNDVTSEIMFNVDALQGTIGKFKTFDIEFIKTETSSKLTVNIDVKSIYTANSMRDESLLGEGFFETDKYPDMIFFSETIAKSDTGYIAKGKMNMMGIEKDLDIPFVFKGIVDNPDEEIAVFEGNLAIDRTEFGMEHTASVGDDVSINFYTELKKEK